MVAENTSTDPSAGLGADCITFTCDEGYLFPTLVAAKMAKSHAPTNTDVVIFVESPGISEERRLQIEAASGASLRAIPQSVVRLLDEQVSESIFVRTRASRAALYRLFLAELLDNNYRRILYLDGDIQIRRSLAPLFALDLPDDFVAAVPDWAAIHLLSGMKIPEEERAFFEALFTDIHLPPEQWGSYFNSGVMLATPKTWKRIGPAALDFLVENPDACKFVDQCALNYACRDHVMLLPLRWNFLRGFMHSPAYRVIDPAIIHYTGRPKPWDGSYAPWGPAEFLPYVEMARALEGAGVDWRRQPLQRRLAYHLKPLVRKHPYDNAAYRAELEQALLKCSAIEPLQRTA